MMHWEVCYEILVTNQNFHFSEFNFLKKYIYVNKGILLILDNLVFFIKFNFFIGQNILQLVFDFVT